MWYRLRNDFLLAILTLLGACGTLGILPFAIYRFATGNVVAGVIDSAIMLTIVASAVYAWRTGNTRIAAWFDVVLTMTGCIAVSMMLGRAGLFWMYASVLSTFLLLRHREAVLVTAVALAVLAIHGKAFESTLEMGQFIISASVVALFSFIFAYHAEQLRKQMELLASRDPLTGASNRRSMEDELLRAIEMSRRERRPYGLAILDLDHFKQINDRYGHAVGDQVLIDFVRLVKAATRKVDRLFRYGGEEFVLLLPGADTTALRTVLDGLRTRIGESLHVRGEVVTTSIGAAALMPGEDWEAWMVRADAALYRAKHDGRNRSVIADEFVRDLSLVEAEQAEPVLP